MAEVDINKPWLHNVTEAAPCQCECHSEPIGLDFPLSRKTTLKSTLEYWKDLWEAEQNKYFAEKGHVEICNHSLDLYVKLVHNQAAELEALRVKLNQLRVQLNQANDKSATESYNRAGL